MPDEPRKPGKDTQLRDAAEARAIRAEEDEALASQWAREALTERAAAAERAAHLWFRLSLALVAVLSMLVAGTVAVGAGITIPGVGSFEVSKAPTVERAAPMVEAANEGSEARDDAGGP